MSNPEELARILLREADSLLLGLFSNALIGVYVIQDGRFVFVNQRLADIFGYSQDELCSGIGPNTLTAPADRPLMNGEIERRIRGEAEASHYGFHGIRKDGSQFDVEVFGVRTTFRGQPAIIGMLADVSARHTAERGYADQLRFIEQLIETIPSPVFYKDECGRYLGCNRAFEGYIGMDRAEVIGRTVFDISPPDLAERYHAADQALFDNPGTQNYETTVKNADGTRHDVIFYKASFAKSDGSLGGLVGVILDISERKRMEELVWREANYDALTGLPNRRLMRDRLQEESKRAQRSGRNLALMFIDLDRFKEVNDTLGHRIGDLLLAEAARRIRDCVRASDTVARQGGDEFIVILPEVIDAAAVGHIARVIIDALSLPFFLDGQVAYVSASIGIALHPFDTEELDTLLSYADQAMYRAKADGRNRFCYFVPVFQQQALARLELANDLRKAISQGELQLYYQPIIEQASGRVVKAEALLRWFHPQRGAVGPDRFIPVAEEIGIINEIGDWVFRQAATTALRWNELADRKQSGKHVQISINKSPRQFLTGNTHESWIDFLKQLGLPTECIAVEITEGLLLDQRPEVVSKLLAFRDAGIQVSLDDFGTGYSAMSYLKKFDIDYLKIDKSFVRDMGGDPSDRAIVEAIIVMAHKLAIKVIAEGVETAEQRDILHEAGCDYAQGYFFAKPMPAADFERFMNWQAAEENP